MPTPRRAPQLFRSMLKDKSALYSPLTGPTAAMSAADNAGKGETGLVTFFLLQSLAIHAS
jgi:hypothetical protein